MGRRSLARSLVIGLTVSMVIGSVVLGQTEEKAQPKKKKVAMTPAPAAQTQTAPATTGKSGEKATTPANSSGKGKSAAPKDPKEAGWKTVQGRVVTVHPEQHSLIIQASTLQYQVYVTPQTQLIRDGQPAEIGALQANDRVDQCHFNAKHVVQTLKVTSAEKALQTTPNPEHK